MSYSLEAQNEDLRASNQKLNDALKQAKELLQQQNESLETIMAAPISRAVVVEVLGMVLGRNRYLVAAGEGLLEVQALKGISPSPGDVVRLTGSAIAEIVKQDRPLGNLGRVDRIVDANNVEIEHEGKKRILRNQLKCEIGDQVIVDASESVTMFNLGKATGRFTPEILKVSWNDIGGLKEAKRQMIEAVEMPVTHAAIYAKYNKKQLKGVLLYGPPGCGKTMLGKATATALKEVHGVKNTGDGFMYVRGPEVLSKWVGESEMTVRSLFERARSHKKKFGYPAVIFIDEAESLLGSRTASEHQASRFMSSTIVPTFLAEMDGVEESSAVVLLSTNHPDSLDPAITREGRIDRKVFVNRPNKADALEIFEKHLSKVPLNSDLTKKEMAKVGAEETFSTTNKMYDVQFKSGSIREFTLGDLLSGAMVAGIVDQATSLAMHRDIETNTRKHGLKDEDLKMAVSLIRKQNHHLDHSEDIMAFAAAVGESVKGINKVSLE